MTRLGDDKVPRRARPFVLLRGARFERSVYLGKKIPRFGGAAPCKIARRGPHDVDIVADDPTRAWLGEVQSCGGCRERLLDDLLSKRSGHAHPGNDANLEVWGPGVDVLFNPRPDEDLEASQLHSRRAKEGAVGGDPRLVDRDR